METNANELSKLVTVLTVTDYATLRTAWHHSLKRETSVVKAVFLKGHSAPSLLLYISGDKLEIYNNWADFFSAHPECKAEGAEQ